MGAGELGAVECGAGQVRPAQVRRGQLCPVQIRPSKAGACEHGSCENGAVEVRCVEILLSKIEVRELRLLEVDAGEVVRFQRDLQALFLRLGALFGRGRLTVAIVLPRSHIDKDLDDEHGECDEGSCHEREAEIAPSNRVLVCRPPKVNAWNDCAY